MKLKINKLFQNLFLVSFIISSCSKTEINNQNSTKTSSLSCENVGWNSSVSYENVKDIDGNLYKTVKIGSQIWMAENLRTFRYNNGDSIYYHKENSSTSMWNGIKIGAVKLIYLAKDMNNPTIDYSKCYGNYYNYHAVEDQRNVCPSGWHVSTVSDWDNLKKSIDTSVLTSDFISVITSQNGWVSKNGTDNYGLRILPSMNTNLQYAETTSQFADFWCLDSLEVFSFQTYSIYNSKIQKVGFKNLGKTIRCVQD